MTTINSNYSLGLDLGSNSIGWALLDEKAQRLVAAGVRIFPEGVDRDQQGGEHSKNEQRRIARGMRRQIARRARRKRLLRKILVTAGLLPEVALKRANDPERGQWERDQFRESNPYALRRRALSQRLEPYQIGRLLVHLNQRRGFLSNRKVDRTRKKENSDILKEISGLASEMGNRKLGQFLAEIHEANPHSRLRGRHTHRDMFEQEFEAIWTAQQCFHPGLLTDQLKYGTEGKQRYPCPPKGLGSHEFLAKFGIHGLIFYQRPIYWPKSVVGQCELEPKKKRCPRGDRLAQRFRLLQEVNNLRLLDTSTGEERPLKPEERGELLRYLSKSKEKKFSDIRKHLGMLESVRFNLEQGGRDKLLGMQTDYWLANAKLFGKGWYDRPEEVRNEIVKVLLDDKIEDSEKVRRAVEDWGMGQEAAEKLIDTDLPEGFASYSREAIAKVLPHLERGLPMTAGPGIPCALREAGYLLAHEQTVHQRDLLPKPPELTNPLVRQALHEFRKVMNAIIRTYGKPGHIHIEMAREVKGTKLQRQRYSEEIRERERRRDDAARRIRETGTKPTGEAIDRFLLWEEQKKLCIYSGRPISLTQLLAGEVDMDHILPFSRSLDNSLMNRVVCFRTENALKGNRTPSEWLAESNPDKFNEILQRAVNLPYGKAKKFRQLSVKLEEFIARQLVDTTYITTQVLQYLRCLGVDVVCSKGQLTAELRRHWGLNDILRQDGLNLKNREDHRHHAVDAIVIALTNRWRLQQLAAVRRQGGTERTGEVLPDPWANFRRDVETSVNLINVSHKVRRKVFGPLHNEMLYGATAKPNSRHQRRPWAAAWVEKDQTYVRRKNVSELNNTKQLRKVRDITIREILKTFLRDHQIDPDTPQKIASSVWKQPPTMPSGVPIKKVRLLEYGDGFVEIRKGSHAELSSNHHYEIVEQLDEAGQPVLDGKGVTKRKGYLVTMFEAAKRERRAQEEFRNARHTVKSFHMSEGERTNRLAAEMRRISQEYSVIRKDHGPRERFVMSLSINELVYLELEDGSKRLHRVQKMSEGSIILRPHTYAGEASDTDKPPIIQRRGPNTLRGEKVVVDCIGRIRRARD